MKIIDNNANDLNFMSNRPDERENTDKSTYRLQKKISYLKQRTVYRFISLDVFQKIIQNKKIYFSLPSKWSDTFEESFIKAIQIAKIEKALDPIFIREILCSKGRYYCSCWTKTAESQRFWDEYGYNNTALRIEIDLEDLLVHHNINCYDVKYADFFTLDDFLLTKE